MKKRFLAVLLALVLVVAMVPLSASAATITASGTCGAEGDGNNLTWTLDSEGTLTISGKGEMDGWAIDDRKPPWYDLRDGIVKLILADGVTSIGPFAFGYCESLTSITIPGSVNSIDNMAFFSCRSLKSVTIPNGVTGIYLEAFMYCTSLTSVTISDSVTSVGNWAFAECPSLTKVTIPASVTKIGISAFGVYNEIELVPGFTITGYTGTAAEEYAEDYGFTFIALDEEKAPEFNDVKESDWFYTPVQWAVANNVTAGTSDTTFSPSNKCTREQAVTFLWNAKGQPEPEGTENPFTDVKEGAWYYKAVLWAVENNITAGVSADKFGVGQPCTRGQIVTFFYNYAERPDASGNNPFTDVPSSQWYYEPVLWAVSNGVTAGMTPTTFGPTSTCTRGQIVTFLYNYLGK